MPRSRSPLADAPGLGVEAVDDEGYAQLAELRAGIRRYLAWAEQRARAHGMTPAQVQLALAVRASRSPVGPTLTELAETLLLRHHSVVGLVDRAERSGFVERVRDEDQPAHVCVRLTPQGSETLRDLSALHLRWLAEFGPETADVWASFAGGRR